MTNTQTTDNIMFIAAIQQLAGLAAEKRLSSAEFEAIKQELERRLRPTIIVSG